MYPRRLSRVLVAHAPNNISRAFPKGRQRLRPSSNFVNEFGRPASRAGRARRSQLYHRLAMPGDCHIFARERLIDQFRQVVFGFSDRVRGHRISFDIFWPKLARKSTREAGRPLGEPACRERTMRGIVLNPLPKGPSSLIVVFDIGNVLVRWNPRNLFRKTFKDEARMERFLAAALSMDFIALTDIVADFSRAVAERARTFPEFARELRLFDERWVETIGDPIVENVALLRRLKAAGRPVYALSNFASVKFVLARRMFGFLNEFDLCVISGQVGVAKPDPRIYEILIERAGRDPGELLFVDDSLVNVRAAEQAGMGAIHYAPGVDLERELCLRGALPTIHAESLGSAIVKT